MIISERPSEELLYKTFSSFTNKPFQKDKIFFETNLKEEEDVFEKKYGNLITSFSILSALGIGYVIYKGGKLFDFSKFVKKNVNKISANTLEKLKNSKTTDFDLIQRLKFNCAINTVNILKKAEGIANFNPIKDYAADKVLEKIKLKPIFDWINDKFVYYGKNLAFSKYKKPKEDFQKLTHSLNNVAKIYSKTGEKELSKEIVSNIKKINENLNSIINGFDKRFDKTVDVLNKNSSTEFWRGVADLKGKTLKEKIFGKISDFCEFIPAKRMEPYKNDLFENLLKTKNVISNNYSDLTKNLNNKLDDIFYSDALQNKTLRKNYIQIKEYLNKLSKKVNDNKFSKKDIKNNLINEVEKMTDELLKSDDKKVSVKKAQEMLEILKNDKIGDIEKTIKKCENIKEIAPELYMKIISQRNKFQKSLNNAVNFETDKSYRKLLDFSLHSLATDLFTQFSGLGTMLYILLNRKKTKEEKISENLKVGIPVFGGLFVGFLCNLRQIASGPGSLLFATLSGFVLNRIGSFVSKNYLEKNQETEKKE